MVVGWGGAVVASVTSASIIVFLPSFNDNTGKTSTAVLHELTSTSVVFTMYIISFRAYTPVARVLIHTIAAFASSTSIAAVVSSTSAMIVGWGGAVVRTTSCHTILVTSAIVGIVCAMWWFDAGGTIGRGAR